MNLFKFLKPKTQVRRRNVSTATKSKIVSDWSKISVMLDGGTPSQLKQALITADKTLDAALKDISNGETMGERLKDAKDAFSNWSIYQDVWSAHKYRNALVHEVDFDPPHYVLKSAIEKLKNGLKDLGVNL